MLKKILLLTATTVSMYASTFQPISVAGVPQYRTSTANKVPTNPPSAQEDLPALRQAAHAELQDLSAQLEQAKANAREMTKMHNEAAQLLMKALEENSGLQKQTATLPLQLLELSEAETRNAIESAYAADLIGMTRTFYSEMSELRLAEQGKKFTYFLAETTRAVLECATSTGVVFYTENRDAGR